MKHKLDVKTSLNTYPAIVGQNILKKALSETLSAVGTDKLFLLIDQNVHQHFGDVMLQTLLEFADDVKLFVVPQGEESKSVTFWSRSVDFLLASGVRRNTPLIVAGGGVTGDLGGFVAATVLRGVPLIHIPTTVLAMVDSSIGGKTGINHQTGKNLIGSFYQPAAVIADLDFLTTLPHREWINGLSEILKYAAIRDAAIFDEANLFFTEDLSSIDKTKLASLILKCIKIKADIVKEDEYEGGIRAFLNYGHTFAHALEKACDFDSMSHGEAVFLGMLAAGELSRLTGDGLSENRLDPYRKLYHYRVRSEELSSEEIYSFMFQDKKRTDQHLKFVLLENRQEPVIKTITDKKLILAAIEKAIAELP